MNHQKSHVRRHSADDVVAAARAWIGTPYHHQASACGVGSDCLGLVRGVYRALYGAEAENPPAYSQDWAEATGEETLSEAARRHLLRRPVHKMSAGDVILFRIKQHSVAKHAGIATSNNTMVHAMEGVPVCEVTLTKWWRRRIAFVFSFPGVEF